MRTELQNKCDQLIQNYKLLRTGNRLEYPSLVAAGAALYLEEGKAVDPVRLKECKKLLKNRKGIFSNFRGISEFVLRCKMALSDDPEVYLANLDTVYKGLRSFFSGEQVLHAAMVIADSVSPSEYDAATQKTKAIYKEMHKAHPWLTSQDDMPFAALMAILGSDETEVFQEAENIYGILKQDLRASLESKQMLSHVLSFSKGMAEVKTDKICRIAEELRAARHPLGRDRYISILGTLAPSELPAGELADMICEADDYLKKFRPFRGIFGTGRQTRRMFAVQMTEAALGEKGYASMTGAAGISSMVSTSIEVTIITLIMLYTIIAMSAASSAASH